MEKEIVSQSEVEQTKPAIKHGWLRALLFFIASLIAAGVGQMVGIMIVALMFGLDIKEIFQDKSFIKNLGSWGSFIYNLFGFLFMLFVVWIFRKFIDKKSMLSLGLEFKKYKSDFIQGMLWGIGLMSFGFITLIILGNLSVESMYFLPVTFLGYVFLFFVVSLNEELMVRGYILNNLLNSVNKYVALIITASLFGILHLGNPNVTVVGFINIILAGVLLGIYYIHKKNLWFPIGIHFTWNLFQGPVFGFEVSGTTSIPFITQSIQGNELLTGGEFGFEASLLATFLMIVSILIVHFQFKEKAVQTNPYF